MLIDITTGMMRVAILTDTNSGISKEEAEKKYLNHYEEINNTPCNNCKWITKYERKSIIYY